MSEEFFIGELSRRTGVPTQTIRYYERMNLIKPPERTDSGYRLYTEDDEARLRFIQHAKLFGLSLVEIKSLINLRAQGAVPCERLRELVAVHLDDLEHRIREMIVFRDELRLRYQRITESIDAPNGGLICGLIEQEKTNSRTAKP